jgi:capsular polysaccharide biosynthesis protein
VYSTDDGFGFFGLWLTDDCTKYLLTENEGLPIYSDAQSSQHTIDYEKLLEMKPLRLRNAYLKEAILFNDYGQNLHKKERFRKISNKILHNVNAQRHPGVFILRRNSGKRRTMHNELEMAEHLHRSRGFRILDITVADVPTIISTCAGAQVVAGIEGSHLVHGIMVLQPGCSVLTLQPPNRFCSVIKRTTDRDGQNFGFVVGRAEKDGFWVDADEVERTLDLFPKTKDITR